MSSAATTTSPTPRGRLRSIKALGWETPIFAHVPLIHGPDGAKLSKRHGALGVDAYRDMGYLPAALRNYLVRLGWSHGDDEIMSTEDMVGWFDLDAIGRSAARFDFAKLENLNGHYLRAMPDAEIIERLKALVPELPNGGELTAKIDAEGWDKLERALPGLKERAKTLVELLDNAEYLFAERPLGLDGKPRSCSMRPGARSSARCCRSSKPSSRGRRRRSILPSAPMPTRQDSSLARWRSRSARPSPAGRRRPGSSTCSRCSAATNRSRASAIRIWKPKLHRFCAC